MKSEVCYANRASPTVSTKQHQDLFRQLYQHLCSANHLRVQCSITLSTASQPVAMLYQFDLHCRTAVNGRHRMAGKHLELIGQYWYWRLGAQKSTAQYPIQPSASKYWTTPDIIMLISF